jgi:hypothetical protein
MDSFGKGGDRMKRRHVYFGTAALTAGALLLAAGYWVGRASRPEEDLARTSPRTVYVIQEFLWRFRGNRSLLLQDDGRPGKPVRAFVERGRADAHCQKLNRQKRATANPFRYMPEGADGGGGSYLDQYNTLGETAILALLQAEGITPPVVASSTDFDAQAYVWTDWWEEHRQEWDDRLVERLWDVLDLLWFYEVVAVAVEP